MGFSMKNRKDRSPDYGMLILGLFCLAIVIFFFCIKFLSDKRMPGDAKWYRAEVKQVVSVRESREIEVDTKGRQNIKTFFYCTVILQYEVDGTIYNRNYESKEDNGPIKVGEDFYLKISPKNPKNVYQITKYAEGERDYYIVLVVGLGIVAIPIGLGMYGRKKTKKEDTDIMYSEADTE